MNHFLRNRMIRKDASADAGALEAQAVAADR